MPEIGATLRETRMRAGLDISDIEASTKIRAKYLRALENEEWDLLPGPTFVKSFLRTYAEALDLDPRILLEEYKSRYERFDEHVGAVQRTPGPAAGRERRPARRSHPGRWIILASAVIVVVIVLILLGGGDSPKPTAAGTDTTSSLAPDTTGTTSTTATSGTTKAAPPAAPAVVKLQVIPTGDVSVCLVKAGGTKLIVGQTMQAGTPSQTFRSSKFLISLGNGNVKLKIDGKTRSVPTTSVPVGYRITSSGRTKLAAIDLPSCA